MQVNGFNVHGRTCTHKQYIKHDYIYATKQCKKPFITYWAHKYFHEPH